MDEAIEGEIYAKQVGGVSGNSTTYGLSKLLTYDIRRPINWTLMPE